MADNKDIKPSNVDSMAPLGTKSAAPVPQMPGEGAASLVSVDEARPVNLTRASIEAILVGQYITAGKSTDEAKKLAKLRAAEMIQD